MPMVRGRDDYCIDALVVQYLAVIPVGYCRRRARAGLHLVAPWGVHIAHRHDLKRHAGILSRVEQLSHATPSADHTDPKSVIRSENVCGGERGKSPCDEEAAAIGCVGHGTPVDLAVPRMVTKAAQGLVRGRRNDRQLTDDR